MLPSAAVARSVHGDDLARDVLAAGAGTDAACWAVGIRIAFGPVGTERGLEPAYTVAERSRGTLGRRRA
jgi:hypothetical protein